MSGYDKWDPADLPVTGTVSIVQVIRTTLAVRGNGVDVPFQRYTQYWTMDGRFLAEAPWSGGDDQ